MMGFIIYYDISVLKMIFIVDKQIKQMVNVVIVFLVSNLRILEIKHIIFWDVNNVLKVYLIVKIVVMMQKLKIKYVLYVMVIYNYII